MTKKELLVTDLPAFLAKLTSGTKSNFGLMTPQHMVEHLIVVIKSSSKKYVGVRETPPNKRQLGFKKFINSGCVMEHRPSDKTIADLPPLRYNSLEAAIAAIPEAVQRFYKLWNDHPDYIPYNPFMGELSFEALELFHYNHARYHLWQFGLIEQYP